jgi:hypothetical protein
MPRSRSAEGDGDAAMRWLYRRSIRRADLREADRKAEALAAKRHRWI